MKRYALIVAASACCTVTAVASAVKAPSPTPVRPERVMAKGKAISVDVGHAAPCYADIDGDGKAELLVGQFADGKLRIYRNRGDNAAPRFDDFAWFEAGGSTGKVPSG